MRRLTVAPRPMVATLTFVALLLGVSCGVPAESSPRQIPQSAIPDALKPSDTVAVATSASPVERVDLWFVREGQLVSVRHSVPAPTDPTSVVDELLSGPTDSERSSSLRSAIPDAGAVEGVSVRAGKATVKLSTAFSEIPAADQLLAVAQLVLTLTDLRGIGLVEFTVGDAAVLVPLPHGDTSTGSVSRDDYLELSKPIP